MTRLAIASTIVAILMGALVVFIRMKSQKKPVSAKKIILPPLFMSTGALMFLIPMFRVTYLQILEAFALGLLCSILLIKTSKFEVTDGQVFLKRSKAFIFILIGLLLVRIIAKLLLSTTIEYGELAGMFWILAFGMILPWRIAMFIQFRKVQSSLGEVR